MLQEIQIIPLKVPCYLVKTGRVFLLIDSGDSSACAILQQALDQAGVKPGNLAMVILTHGDFDHAGNAAFLREKYGARVAMHAEDAEMVRRGDQGWNRKAKPDRVTFFGRMIMFVSTHLIKPAPFQVFAPDLFVEEGTALMEDGFDAKILHLPGHSRGSIGVFTADGRLFCGDLLMNMIKPDLHFMIDDSSACQASIEKLKKLDITLIYPGHGKPFSPRQFSRLQ